MRRGMQSSSPMVPQAGAHKVKRKLEDNQAVTMEEGTQQNQIAQSMTWLDRLADIRETMASRLDSVDGVTPAAKCASDQAWRAKLNSLLEAHFGKKED